MPKLTYDTIPTRESTVVTTKHVIRVKRPYRKRSTEVVYDPDTIPETEHEHELQLALFDLRLKLQKTEWARQDLKIDLQIQKNESFIRLAVIGLLFGSYPLMIVLCWMAFAPGPLM